MKKVEEHSDKIKSEIRFGLNLAPEGERGGSFIRIPNGQVGEVSCAPAHYLEGDESVRVAVIRVNGKLTRSSLFRSQEKGDIYYIRGGENV